MSTEVIAAAIGSGLLSGGGAGYVVSLYQAKKQAEHNAGLLQLERDKFDLELERHRITTALDTRASRAQFIGSVKVLAEQMVALYYKVDAQSSTGSRDDKCDAVIGTMQELGVIQDDVIRLMREGFVHWETALVHHMAQSAHALRSLVTTKDGQEYVEATQQFMDKSSKLFIGIGDSMRANESGERRD